MQTLIRVTSLSSFIKCPKKFFEDKSEPKIEQTYHGDLVNIAANSKDWVIDEFVDYYTKHINEDIRITDSLKRIGKDIKKYINSLYKSEEKVYQESKMFYKYTNDIYITGSPDIFCIAKDWSLCIIDIKCWSISSYYWEEKRDNLQTVIYPLFVMERFNKNECTFMYKVFDKKTWKNTSFKIKRTKQECIDIVNDAMHKYLAADLTGQYKPKKNQTCWFCPLRSHCPTWKWYIELDEKDKFF